MPSFQGWLSSAKGSVHCGKLAGTQVVHYSLKGGLYKDYIGIMEKKRRLSYANRVHIRVIWAIVSTP